MQNARSLGLDVTFFCLNWCSNAQVIQSGRGCGRGPHGDDALCAPERGRARDARHPRVPGVPKGESPQGKTNAYTQGWWTFAAFAEGMRRVLAAGEEFTGANIKAALETFADYDLGGVTAPVTFTPTDHRGSKGLRIFRVEEGTWAPFTDFVDAPGW